MPGTEIAEALLALARGETDRAVALLDSSVSGGRLAPALRAHLERPIASSVYDSTAAFAEFIDGGGNVGLYRSLIELLGSLHAEALPRTVLDIGCGDGRVAAETLSAATTDIDLVEPSGDLLDVATRKLARHSLAVHAHPIGIQRFLAGCDGSWDLVQSTFALHSIEPTERSRLLEDLAGRTRRLVLAEFDVPGYRDGSMDHARHLAERYEAGLAEYPDSPLVAQGFLMPVLAGQLDVERPRHTWEQPISAWVADLRVAGFGEVETRAVHDHWWAPAVLVQARSG